MKRIFWVLLLILVLGAGLLLSGFRAQPLKLGPAMVFAEPDTSRVPASLRVSAILAGRMVSNAAFSYRGGDLGDERVFGMDALLIRHPRGMLLVDTGFGASVDDHFLTTPKMLQLTSRYEKEATVASQLAAAGISRAGLSGILLTHAHWDHVSGLENLPGVPVYVPAAEREYIDGGHEATVLARLLGTDNYRSYDFPGPSYLGFPQSRDWFGDGSVVLVPVPGHTPGSVIVFVNLPDGSSLALIGDTAWQSEGVSIPAERPWLVRRMLQEDEAGVRVALKRLHQLQAARPRLSILPAHDRRAWARLPRLEERPLSR